MFLSCICSSLQIRFGLSALMTVYVNAEVSRFSLVKSFDMLVKPPM